jgi:membrane-bound metal-dependent hydrolase YbcI (DUF457 family)
VKGIAHFVTGVAIATCFPEIVQSASQNLAFGPVLAGFAGLLPDTLDFKFARYFERLDDKVDPNAICTEDGQPDPQAIAERIAAAAHRAYQTNQQVKILLPTVRLGADLWRQWSVIFSDSHQVLVRLGPAVTTGQVPLANSQLPGTSIGCATVGPRILQTYGDEIRIDIFGGPTLALDKVGDAVEVTFLPWHRRWSHSLLMALFLSMVGWLLAPVYGLAMGLAVLAHVLEDQMGFMGSNLLFPLIRGRTRGLGLFLSSDPLANLVTVWVGVAVILLNLDRFSTVPSIQVLPYVLVAILLPCLLFGAYAAWGRRELERRPTSGPQRDVPSMMAAVEALDETGEVDI